MSSRVLAMTSRALGVARTVPGRSLSTAPRLQHKESSSHDDAGADVARHKEDLLNKHRENKAQWKPELASNSEEAVKADREDHGSIKDLQEKTKGHASNKA